MRKCSEFVNIHTKRISEGLTNVLNEINNFYTVEYEIEYINGQASEDSLKSIGNLTKKAGIYVIQDVGESCTRLINEHWDGYKSEFKTVPKRNQIEAPASIIYVGKNETNLGNRIKQHLTTVESTYALKLNSFFDHIDNRDNHTLKITCHYYGGEIKVLTREMKMLIRAIEGYFYEEMSPLIGSSK